MSCFLITTPVLAGDPPIQISPTDGATIGSSKLEWQVPVYPLYPTDTYRIQVDNDSDFSSTFRDYKTKNTYYTPVLDLGNWYWRVKAKDEGGTWSDWSSIWSFILTDATPTPTPTPSPTLTPTATPNPTKTPSPAPTPKKTTAPTNTPTSAQTSTPTPSLTFTPKSTPSPSITQKYRIASVAAVSTSASAFPSPEIEIKNQKQTNPFLWIGIFLILLGTGSIGYIYLKSNGKIPLKFGK